MDLDLDLFDRDRDRHRDRHRDRRRDAYRRHDDRRRPSRDRGWSRRDHPHVFSWVMLGGAALLLGLAALALASSLGAWGMVSDAYFALTTAILPASWHDEWTALPGLAHVALFLGSLFLVTGLLGELID